MKGPLQLRAHVSPWYSGFEFLLFSEDSVIDEEFKINERDQLGFNSPTFKLNHQLAQVLFDDLWHAGLRPTDGTGSVGQLKATQDHLKDMQSIVTRLLDDKLK